MNRILLLIDHKGNRRLVAKMLAAHYDVLPAESDQALDGPFDLCLVDGPTLDRLADRVRAKKESEQPVFLPVLLVTARRDVGMVTRHLWQTIDELIVSPIEKVELQARMESLLRARRLSQELKRRDEESLKSSETLYHDLVETSQDLIWQCDAEARFTYLNPAWEDVFGYTVEEMLGKRFTDFQSPEYAERDLKEFARLMTGTYVKGFETVHLGKDGREIHLVFNAKFLCDQAGNIAGTRGTAYDITERKRAEAALRESEARLRLVMDGLGPQMFVGLLDTEGMILAANRPALEAAGLRLEDVLGKPTHETYWFTYSDDVSQRFRAAVQRSAQGETVRYDEQIRVADGQLIWVAFTVHPVRDGSGKVAFLVPSAVVIHERKLAEAALREREQQLRLFVEHSPAAIAMPDRNLRYLVASRRWLSDYNLGNQDIIGRSHYDVFPEIPEEAQPGGGDAAGRHGLDASILWRGRADCRPGDAASA
jgi:PAS domain S-box-containing protein